MSQCTGAGQTGCESQRLKDVPQKVATKKRVKAQLTAASRWLLTIGCRYVLQTCPIKLGLVRAD